MVITVILHLIAVVTQILVILIQLVIVTQQVLLSGGPDDAGQAIIVEHIPPFSLHILPPIVIPRMVGMATAMEDLMEELSSM